MAMAPFSKISWLIFYCCIVFSRGNVIEGPGVPCYDEMGKAQVRLLISLFDCCHLSNSFEALRKL